MMKESFLTIPCHWDKDTLKEILILKEDKGMVVKEMYGVSPLSPIGHGRNPLVLNKIKEKEVYEFRELLKGEGIDFAYILNSPLTDSDIENKIDEIKKHLEWILFELSPDSLIITSLKIMKLVREISNIPITISTIARVQTIADLDKYLEVKPSKLVIQHDVNRNFGELKKLIKFAKGKNVSIEIMLTESCRRRCPLMVEHYKTVGRGGEDIDFHRSCNFKKLSSPEEFLLANFIRPEDVVFYEELGIRHFKITGRSKNPSWLPKVVGAYLNRKFGGNLIRLLGIDPCLNAEKWIYLSNTSLEGFLEGFRERDNIQEEEEYCKKWIKKLYSEGHFYVTDTEYEVRDNSLIPKTDIKDNPQIKNTYFKKNEN